MGIVSGGISSLSEESCSVQENDVTAADRSLDFEVNNLEGLALERLEAGTGVGVELDMLAACFRASMATECSRRCASTASRRCSCVAELSCSVCSVCLVRRKRQLCH